MKIRYDCSDCMFHEVFWSDAGDYIFDEGCECVAIEDDRGWHEACCRECVGSMDAMKCPWFKER